MHSPSLVTPQVQAPVSVAPLPAHPTSAAVVQDARLLLGFITISSSLDTGARRFHADLFALTSLLLEVDYHWCPAFASWERAVRLAPRRFLGPSSSVCSPPGPRLRNSTHSALPLPATLCSSRSLPQGDGHVSSALGCLVGVGHVSSALGMSRRRWACSVKCSGGQYVVSGGTAYVTRVRGPVSLSSPRTLKPAR